MSTNTSRNRLWSWTHAERAALARDLAELDDEQWAAGSLCGRWSVQEAVAHLTAGASVGPARWFASVVGAGFDFDLHNDRRLAEHLGTSPGDTLARFRGIITSTTSTLGPTEAWLGEVIVHGEDIRRPLGIGRTVPVEAVTAVADFYARRDFTVDSRKTIAGLRLEASDGPFATGRPLVHGTTLALTMAMAGRESHCDELAGDGLEILRARCAGRCVGGSEGNPRP
ncbi:maleylpyruvate isomerase family mycothiol-dependent enzyme [Paeniglutamicibacter sp. MACA_103]|uniref:maleylpyruvate isomerase family mycothiol-dependent enzyme n=1 Tax=Paeniglutamicibacter sp. MACA_103 TaxID=3377337 RepID=UPI0038949269